MVRFRGARTPTRQPRRRKHPPTQDMQMERNGLPARRSLQARKLAAAGRTALTPLCTRAQALDNLEAGVGPIMFSGRTHSSNCSAVNAFRAKAASFSVVPSWWAFLAILL